MQRFIGDGAQLWTSQRRHGHNGIRTTLHAPIAYIV